MKKTSALLVGRGRWAKHLNFYLSSTQNNPAESFSLNSWNRTEGLLKLQSLLAQSTIVYLAISDSALNEIVQICRSFDYHGPLIHFSGSLNIQDAICAHPLMTFTHDLYPVTFYPQIPFVLTGVGSLQDIFPNFKNPTSVLNEDQKALYHALCVVGGNFSTLLMQKMILGFRELGVPTSFAQPYLQKILQNVLQNPEQALTGPLARKETGTVSTNLKALGQDPVAGIYRAMVHAYAPELENKLPPIKEIG